MTENNALARQFTPASLLRFALPNIVMMVFFSLYIIVDGMFISRLVGTVALSAVNMAYPVTSIQLAVGIMLGSGGSAVVALKLGRGDQREAAEDFTCLVVTAALVGLLFTLFGIPYLRQILTWLGTSALQMPDCLVYTRILLWFAPVMFLQTVFQNYFVTAGKPGLGLVCTVIGGVLNMGLDWLFMGPMQMGVGGAAIATGIGYSVPALVGLVYFSVKRKESLHFVRFRVRFKMLLWTCANGSSEMVANAAIAVTTFLFNVIFMRYWAEEGVAAITIIQYFQFVFSAVFLGFSMGAAPVISFKYGAGDRRQLRFAVRFGLLFVLLCSVAEFLISVLTDSWALGLFTRSDGPVYRIALKGFPIFALSFLLMGFNIFASSLFTALSNGAVSAIISLARTFVFLVGSLLLLPRLLGEIGVWLAVPAAEFLGLLVSVGFLLAGRSRYGYSLDFRKLNE